MKQKIVKYGVVELALFSVLLVVPCYAGFLDSVTDSLSKAGDVISETTGEVVDSATEAAKSVGEKVGLVDKKEETDSASHKKTATETAKSDSAQAKLPEGGNKTQAEQVAHKQAEEQQKQPSEQQIAAGDCDEWSKRLEVFMGGEKGLMAYPTDDMALIAKWRKLYGEAKETLATYPSGLCSRADGVAQYVQTKLADFAVIDKAAKSQEAQAKKREGGFYFSAKPFSATGEGEEQDSFAAGDNIYGLIKMTKKWSEVYNQKQNFTLRVDVSIDGKKIHAQFVTIKSPEYAQRDYLIFNIAPAVEELKAYGDPNIGYGKTTASIIQGPNELTHHLGSLAPGSHNVSFGLYYYGKSWAQGAFTVSGTDFSPYANLHEQIATGVVSARTLPAAKMQNTKLEAQMTALLKNAGWDNVYRINIVDKDWWIERTNGGNTPVKARYLAAVALTQKSDGSYEYKKCTFHQDMMITGNFGEMYLSHQGDAVGIKKENIDK